MIKFPRQQQYVLILFLAVFLLGSGVLYWRQQQLNQPLVLEGLTPMNGESEAPEPQTIMVHVAGAVVKQGVINLPLGSRVIDAIEAAGGGLEGSNIHALNLAALLRDEDYIQVPFQEEGEVGEINGEISGKINLNRASKVELETLPGIGPSLADRIIKHREGEGPFRRVEELKNVSGIGEKRFLELKDLVTAP